MHDPHDRGSKWLIGHCADSILHLGGATGFLSCRTVQAEVVASLRTISDPARLEELIDQAARCPDLDTFRAVVSRNQFPLLRDL